MKKKEIKSAGLATATVHPIPRLCVCVCVCVCCLNDFSRNEKKNLMSDAGEIPSFTTSESRRLWVCECVCVCALDAAAVPQMLSTTKKKRHLYRVIPLFFVEPSFYRITVLLHRWIFLFFFFFWGGVSAVLFFCSLRSDADFFSILFHRVTVSPGFLVMTGPFFLCVSSTASFILFLSPTVWLSTADDD